MYDVWIDGVEELKEYLDRVPSMCYEEILGIAERAVEFAKNDAPVSNDPVTGGSLEASIRVEQNSETDIDIVADPVDSRGKHYAEANEFGSLTTPAGTVDSPIPGISTSGKYCFRPFIRPAILLAMYEVDDRLSEKFREENLQ